MNTRILLVGILLLTACAAPSEKDIEAREYREAEKQGELLDFRQRCRSSGGVLVVQSSGGRIRRNALPDDADYFSCRRGVSLR